MPTPRSARRRWPPDPLQRNGSPSRGSQRPARRRGRAPPPGREPPTVEALAPDTIPDAVPSPCAVGPAPRVGPSATRTARQHVVAGAHGSPSPRPTRRHHARNDSRGGTGRSRAWVHRVPGQGSQDSAGRPPGIPRRPTTRPTAPASRSPMANRPADPRPHDAARIATASALGTRSPRWASTTFDRRWTSTPGCRWRPGTRPHRPRRASRRRAASRPGRPRRHPSGEG